MAPTPVADLRRLQRLRPQPLQELLSRLCRRPLKNPLRKIQLWRLRRVGFLVRLLVRFFKGQGYGANLKAKFAETGTV